jgi:hypothetical protein
MRGELAEFPLITPIVGLFYGRKTARFAALSIRKGDPV